MNFQTVDDAQAEALYQYFNGLRSIKLSDLTLNFCTPPPNGDGLLSKAELKSILDLLAQRGLIKLRPGYGGDVFIEPQKAEAAPAAASNQ